MRIAVVTVVVAVCVAIGAYLYLHYIQPASVDTAVQTQPLPSPTSTTTPASQQAVTSASIPSAVPATAGTSAATSTVPSNAAQHPGMKLYRNDEYGFEFWYPEEWEWQANVFGSPFSKYNLTVMKVDGANTNQTTVINIVTPEFAANAVSGNPQKTTRVNVGGVASVEYHFSEGEYPETIIDVPEKTYHILLGCDSADDAQLHTIVSTFVFVSQ